MSNVLDIGQIYNEKRPYRVSIFLAFCKSHTDSWIRRGMTVTLLWIPFSRLYHVRTYICAIGLALHLFCLYYCGNNTYEHINTFQYIYELGDRNILLRSYHMSLENSIV